MTNYERIKAMSIEEMADFLEAIYSCSHCRKMGNDCFPYWDAMKFLESEARE